MRAPAWTGGAVLGIETSCDETSAGVVRDGRILGHVIASQDGHAAFGGVVPEIAARAHLRAIDRVVGAALEEASVAPEELEGVAVTAGPGLVGSLLVGVSWAKAFAFARGLPLLGVHHMEAHLCAGILEDERARPPFVALLVSGGHTLLLHARDWGRYALLGRTRDDAAGEAFDKVARRLGLGYPGGPEIQRLAAGGTPGRFALPRPMLDAALRPGAEGAFDFSFSGLKTAVALLCDEMEREEEGEALAAAVPDIAAEFQEAVVDVLVTKTARAAETLDCPRVLLGGGVACNAPLRIRMREALEGLFGEAAELVAASPRLSTDNGAMVACLGDIRLARGERSGWDLNADPALPFPGLEARAGGARRAPRRRSGRAAADRPGASGRSEEGACTPS